MVARFSVRSRAAGTYTLRGTTRSEASRWEMKSTLSFSSSLQASLAGLRPAKEMLVHICINLFKAFPFWLV